MDDVRKKLEEEILPTTWAALEPHARRQGLFLVREGLELSEVAAAVATDDQAKVKGWIDDESIRRPTVDEVTAWAEDPVAFYAVIVQPFVLCRPITD
ncbi:MAG: DUF2288 family protein [Deltaproteobacteria bacterium]|nr:DUF2288 family protein [Deltaproteobacteria bacterium]